jgi:hypothetical protein
MDKKTDIVQWCDTHGFTLASISTAELSPSGHYSFDGQCGCKLTGRSFYKEPIPGQVQKVTIPIKRTAVAA